jgi:hypothetical protein
LCHARNTKRQALAAASARTTLAVRSGDYFAAGFGKMTRIVVPLADHAFRFQPQIVARDTN